MLDSVLLISYVSDANNVLKNAFFTAAQSALGYLIVRATLRISRYCGDALEASDTGTAEYNQKYSRQVGMKAECNGK